MKLYKLPNRQWELSGRVSPEGIPLWTSKERPRHRGAEIDPDTVDELMELDVAVVKRVSDLDG